MGLDSPLVDKYGRQIRYVRLSITDRCNFRCLYCVHKFGLQYVPHDNILKYEEMLALVSALVRRGITKVRLTGGEPFVRRGFVGFLRQLRERHPDLDLRITTNATFLAEHMPVLKELKVTAVNVSFDTFCPKTFNMITGSTAFDISYKGLLAALESGVRVKLNVVALKGINDQELPDFLAFARRYGVDVRFIEFMPLGGRKKWSQEAFWSADDILSSARQHETLIPVNPTEEGDVILHGPAKMYFLEGSEGRFGIITPVTCNFCNKCNRLRITSDGKFRTCLFSDDEIAFRDILRSQDGGVTKTLELLEKALWDKPLGYQILEHRKKEASVIQRGMSSIGG